MAKRRTTSDSDRETRLAEAALRLLAKQEWEKLTLAAVARAAKLRLSDVLSVIPSKSALPRIVLRVLAKEAARQRRVDKRSGDPRERVFDATMSFFDVQERHAVALKALYRALPYDPPTLFGLRNAVLDLAGELLALAEADVGSSPGAQGTVFAGILIRAVFAWRGDDGEMGKTMAQLDRDLRRAERLLWPTPAKSRARKDK